MVAMQSASIKIVLELSMIIAGPLISLFAPNLDNKYTGVLNLPSPYYFISFLSHKPQSNNQRKSLEQPLHEILLFGVALLSIPYQLHELVHLTQ